MQPFSQIEFGLNNSKEKGKCSPNMALLYRCISMLLLWLLRITVLLISISMLMQVAEKTAGLRAVELKRVPMSLEGSAFRSKFLDVDELLSYCSWFAVRIHFLLYKLLTKMNLVKFSFLLLLFVKSFSWVDLVCLTSITMLAAVSCVLISGCVQKCLFISWNIF